MAIERNRSTRLASLGLLVLVLATGFLLGMAWQRWSGSREARAAPPSATESGDTKDDSRKQGRSFFDRIGATPEQNLEFEATMKAFGEKWKALRNEALAKYGPRYDTIMKEYSDEYDARFEALRQEVRAELRSLMTADQRSVYDSLLVEWDEKRADRKQNGRHGHYGGSRDSK